jgi:flagellar motor switch protein FliN/FliY
MANDEPVLNQDEIEKLFSPPKNPAASASGATDVGNEPPPAGNESFAARAESTATAPAVARRAPGPTQEPDIATQDIEYLLSQAEKALESVNSSQLDDLPKGPGAPGSYNLQEFSPAAPSTEAATLDLIRDVELDLKIELGRTHMYLEDVLKLRKGSVVPLDKLAGDPVDIYVNGRLIARGEVLVLNDNFCVRVAELIVGANVLT